MAAVHYRENVIERLVSFVLEIQGTDLHLTVNSPPAVRLGGRVWRLTEVAAEGPPGPREKARSLLAAYPECGKVFTPGALERTLAVFLGDKNRKGWETFLRDGTSCFSVSVPGVTRLRVAVYKQRGSPAANIRVLGNGVPVIRDLFGSETPLLTVLEEALSIRGGLIVVGGTDVAYTRALLAAMVEHLNLVGSGRVVTVEDPVEYMHRHGRCLIEQLEVKSDVPAVADGVEVAVKTGADVVAVHSVEDRRDAEAVILAAEAGLLVLCAVRSVEPWDAALYLGVKMGVHDAARRIAAVLRYLVHHKCVPRRCGLDQLRAVGVIRVGREFREAVKSGDPDRVAGFMKTGKIEGYPIEHRLAELVETGFVSQEEALDCAPVPDLFRRCYSSMVAGYGTGSSGEVGSDKRMEGDGV